jgi:hypothetical protein
VNGLQESPRARGGRAPDVFVRGGWQPMREHALDRPVDFAIVGAGAGGATLACQLARQGRTVVCFDAGPYWRPLEDFASDEIEQQKLYWTDDRLTGGDDPIALGGNNCGRGVGGSTVHFSMISLRFRPEWFRCRSALGYGFDWPITYEEIEPYYAAAERALCVSGPVRYPWGPSRGAYPYRAHPLNGPAELLARGAERLGVAWASTPLATVSAPRGRSPPCVYRGFCNFGCSTNAKQSALVVWAHDAVKAGAEIRDLAMVGRIETSADGARVTGVHFHREGVWHFQRARHVVVAGYAIETPRLLLASATARHPHGLANGSGLVGTHLTTHAGPGIWATFDEDVRWYKGPPNMAVCEHWNYVDEGKDFHGGYAFMSQGPLPRGRRSWRLRAACGAPTCAARCSTTTARPAMCPLPRSSRAPATASSSPTRSTPSACASRASSSATPTTTAGCSATRSTSWAACSRPSAAATRGPASTRATCWALAAWVARPSRAWSTPTAAAGSCPTSGSATARSSRRAAA